MKKIYYLVFGSLFLSSIPLHAQGRTDTSVHITIVNAEQNDDPIVAERPGYTNPPAVVPKRKFQIESGFYYENDKIKGTDQSTDNYLYPTTFFRYGLTKNFELRLEADIAGYSSSASGVKTTQSGLNPVTIGAKYYICEQKKARPETAFFFGLTLPYIGRDDFQPLYPAPAFGFYFQNTLNDKWSLGYNASMQWSGNDANPVSLLTFSPTYNITQKIAAFAEIYGYFQKYNVPDIRCDGGVAYIPIPNLQLDISAGPGLAGPVTNFFIAAGISVRLPR